MEISVISDWFGIAAGIALGTTWIWKLGRWFHAKIIDAQEGAKFGEELVTELLNCATSPARRADIHAYIQFLSVKTEAESTRAVIQAITMTYTTAIIGIFLAIADRTLVTSAAPWFWRFTIATYVVLVISLGMSFFFNRQLRVLRSAWHNRAGDVLRERAFKHIVET